MAHRDREQKREKRNRFWMSIVLIFFMVIGIFGVFQSGSEKEISEYKEYKFEKINGIYYVEIDGYLRGFNFFPTRLVNISVEGYVKNVFDNAQMVIYAFDPNSGTLRSVDQVRYDLSVNLPKSSYSVTTKQDPIYQLPVGDCLNSTYPIPVILFEESEEVGIVEDNSCIRLRGNSSDFYLLRDRLLYEVFGVMNG